VLGLSLNEAVEKMRGPAETGITRDHPPSGIYPFDVKMTAP